MKNVFKKFLFSFTAMGLMSSFAFGPSQIDGLMANETISVATPVGGAYLVFAGKYGGEIKKSELAGQSELKVDGCARGSRIISYTLEVTKRGAKSSLAAHSNVLTDEMVTKLQGLSPGDTFEFKAMKAYLPNGKDIVDVHGEKFVIV